MRTQKQPELILGVDPGSRRTGFGLIAAVDQDRLVHVEHGVIQLRAEWSMPDRLKSLQEQLSQIYDRYRVHCTVVEKIFFGKNADSAFKLGHARGVCLLVSAQNGVPVEEYAARFVKKCVTGSGAASKEEVQLVAYNILRLQMRNPVAFDATDALSLALTHARVKETNMRLKIAMERST